MGELAHGACIFLTDSKLKQSLMRSKTSCNCKKLKQDKRLTWRDCRLERKERSVSGENFQKKVQVKLALPAEVGSFCVSRSSMVKDAERHVS